MTISIEDAQILTNFRAIEVQKMKELSDLKQITATGLEATIEDQISASGQAIETLGNNPDHLGNDAWNAAMGDLQATRLALIDQNRAIQEMNAIRQGDISVQITVKQEELTAIQKETDTFLAGLITGTSDPNTPLILDRIAAIEGTLLQIAGV